MKRRVIIAGIAAACLYLAVCLLLFASQRRMLYPLRGHAAAPLKPYLPSSGRVVVFFHGNAQLAAELGWLRDHWKRHGIGFVAVEYPGFGGTPGEPTEEGIYAASHAALESVTRAGIAKDRIVLLGQSLGTGPAVEMAKRGWGHRLVLITPFTSVPDAAQLAFPWLPARWLVRDRFDSASKASGVKIPVLVVHGDRDEVVPYELGQRLAPMFAHGKLLTIPGAGHNGLWDRPEMVKAITEFAALP